MASSKGPMANTIGALRHPKKKWRIFLPASVPFLWAGKVLKWPGRPCSPEKLVTYSRICWKRLKGKNVELVSGNIVEALQSIKQQKGKDIWLYGGASLTSIFMNHQLVDEMWLAVVPIVLGKGKALFQNIEQRQHYKISEAVNTNGYLSIKLSKANP